YEQAKQIIQENRTLIDRLVEILVEQETIEGDKFRQIVAEHVPLPEQQLASNF
ncbi:MAG TPA: hypothetical protein DDW76_13825, partial [Cyanobacteria bacterium UBA11369]|nr:hypothetical protein [Cyanobacteria bacterium UBA11369]